MSKRRGDDGPMRNYKARPTTYRGIEMRSRLEAGYAAWLDQWSFDWEYEPQAFASQRGQYLPDFLLKKVPEARADGKVVTTDVYVEVKPAGWTGDLDALARRMAIIAESKVNDTTLLLEVPGRPPRELLVFGYPERQLSWHESAWSYNVAWSDDPHGRPDGIEYLALAVVLGRDLMPWPHGYWDGPT